MTDKEIVKKHPPMEIVTSHDIRVHIFQEHDDGDWEVWLNPTTVPWEGLCIGCGRSRNEAVANAMQLVEGLEGVLQGPPPDVVTQWRNHAKRNK